MKPHKWAKEIKAWADGAEVEFRYNHFPTGEWVYAPLPDFNDTEASFRIKPQPKEPQYLYVTDGANGVKFHREKQFQENPGQWNIGKIKLEDK